MRIKDLPEAAGAVIQLKNERAYIVAVRKVALPKM